MAMVGYLEDEEWGLAYRVSQGRLKGTCWLILRCRRDVCTCFDFFVNDHGVDLKINSIDTQTLNVLY